jgi:hypothetical protein
MSGYPPLDRPALLAYIESRIAGWHSPDPRAEMRELADHIEAGYFDLQVAHWVDEDGNIHGRAPE